MTDLKRTAYLSKVMEQLLADLQHPVGKDGTVLYAEGFKAIVAWHLVRAGWRKPNNLDQFPLVEEYDDPVIKKRSVSGPGVMEDACVWVGAHEPDDPLAGLANMTMGQIEALPEYLRVQAKRRLGLLSTHEPTDPDQIDMPWSAKPLVTITDADDLGTS